MTSAPFEPLDAAARRRIEESLDETLLVEAGAGTGKTHSLVSRVVELVAKGRATVDAIAAITFTEAAAAELRDRIREGLERRAGLTASDEERIRCEQGAAALDQAPIQTLHGFAAALLGECPLEAGLPPSLEIVDEVRAGLLFEEEWQTWLDTAMDAPDLQAPLRVALSMDLAPGALREVARLFHGRYDLVRQASFPDEPLPQPMAAEALATALSELADLCRYAHNGEEDALVGHVREVSRVIERVTERASDPVRVWRLLARSPKLTSGRGRASEWDIEPATGKRACQAIRDRLKELQDTVDQELAAVRRAALMPLLRALRDFVTGYARERKRQGQAEFHDLLVWARDLLRDNIAVRDYFRGRFSHVLIDEFQDTDPIQAEIALFLAEDVAPGTPDEDRPRDWRLVRPAPGRLFVVGDPKQSIYRFRHADITLVDELRNVIGMDALALVQNFRSHRPVIEWVNHVFGQWMRKTDGQPEYVKLEWRWEGGEAPPPASPGVYRFGGPLPVNMPEVRRREALDVANLLRHMLDGGWAVTDRVDEDGVVRFRRARYADICLLVPRRTGLLRDLELTLEDAGVPYRLESASLVFETQEVRDLLNCLEALDNPVDQVALVAALRSPAFACSDVDLLSFLDNGGRLDYLTTQRVAGGPVPEGLAALATFHAESRWTPFPTLIERFVRDRRLMELALGHPRPREQWRRYQFVIDRARVFAEAGGASLRAFLQWMREQQAELARSVETPVPEGDEDAVRILTIHGAKGLEFPIVILGDLSGAPDTRAPSVLLDRHSGAVEVRLGPFQTAGYDPLRQIEVEREAEQQVRLLYVAATRARDHLVVSCYRPEHARQVAAARIDAALEGVSPLWRALEAPPAALATPATFEGGAVPPEETAEERYEWTVARERLLAARSRPPAVAATALAGMASSGEREDDAPEAEPWRRGRAGTSVGRAVHAVLQTIDLAGGGGLAETARAQAQAEGVPEREAEIVRLARTAIESDVVRRAVAAGRWWREVPVGVPVGDGVLEGFIDLLFEEDGGLVVVDYKTDALRSEDDIQQAMDRYRVQGGAYALAVARATGTPVTEVVFVFLQPRREVRLEGLDAIAAEVETAARDFFSVRDPTAR